MDPRMVDLAKFKDVSEIDTNPTPIREPILEKFPEIPSTTGHVLETNQLEAKTM